jgi:hypothetical protein
MNPFQPDEPIARTSSLISLADESRTPARGIPDIWKTRDQFVIPIRQATDYSTSGAYVRVNDAAKSQATNLAPLLARYFTGPPSSLYVLRDVYVHCGAWTLYSSAAGLIVESMPQWYRSDPAGRLRMPHLRRHSDLGLTAQFDNPMVCFMNEPLNNYAHWHYDSLSSLLLSEDALGGNAPLVGFLSRPQLAAWARDSLAFLSGPWTDLRPAEGIVFCRTLLYPSRALISTDPCFYLERLFNCLRMRAHSQWSDPDASASAASARRNRRLYVARFDSPERRTIENEAALAQRLASLGFDIVVPTQMSYVEQVGIFARAELVVGAHGAGLTNIGFCASGTHVVEIFPTTYWVTTFARLAIARNLSYFCFLVEPFAGKDHAMRMRVDVEDLVRRLDGWGLLR